MPPKNRKNRASPQAPTAIPPREDLSVVKEIIRYSCRSLAGYINQHKKTPLSMFDCCFIKEIENVEQYDETIEKAFMYYDISNKNWGNIAKISHHPNLKFVYLADDTDADVEEFVVSDDAETAADAAADAPSAAVAKQQERLCSNERIFIIYNIYAIMYVHKVPLESLGELLYYGFAEYAKVRSKRYEPNIVGFENPTLPNSPYDVFDAMHAAAGGAAGAELAAADGAADGTFTAAAPSVPSAERDLWNFDQILAVMNNKPASFECPTIAPENWMKKVNLSKNGYFRSLSEGYGDLIDCLGPNMFIVGNAASPIPCKLDQPDVLIYFVGIECEKGILQQAYHFILRYFDVNAHIHEKSGSINISGKLLSNGARTTVLISLQVYMNLSEILHDCRLGIHSFATDGYQLWSTTRGVWTLVNRTEICAPYDAIIDDSVYFKSLHELFLAGMAIMLPDDSITFDVILTPGGVQQNSFSFMGYIRFNIRIHGKRFAYGTAEYTHDPPQSQTPFTAEAVLQGGAANELLQAECLFRRYAVGTLIGPPVDRPSVGEASGKFKSGDDNYNNTIEFIMGSNKFELHSTVGDFPPFRNNFTRCIGNYITPKSINQVFDSPKAISGMNKINSFWIVKILNASGGDLLNICTTLAVSTIELASTPTLQRITNTRRTEMLAKLEAESSEKVSVIQPYANSIIGGRDSDLQRHGRGARPCTEQCCDKHDLTSRFIVNRSAAAAAQYTQEDYLNDYMISLRIPAETTMICPICITSVSIWEENVCKTLCGHVFHLQSNSDCSGLIKWCVSGGESSNCPVCRTKIEL